MMKGEDKEAVVRRFFDAVNRHDLQAMAAMTADHYTHEWVGMGPPVDKAQWLKTIGLFFESFPDYTDRIVSLSTASNGHLVLEFEGTGTHSKEWLGVPATGKPFQARYLALIDIRDGQFRMFREYFDTMAFFKQVKLVSSAFF